MPKLAEYINKYELLNAIDKRNGRLPLWLDEILMQDCKVADVAPIVHGHWILVNPPVSLIDWEECSVCGYENFYFSRFKFCPNCGAKMDEVNDEQF